MIIDAVYEAIEDAGVELKDIEACWLGTTTTFFTGLPLAEILKLKNIPISRLCKLQDLLIAVVRRYGKLREHNQITSRLRRLHFH